jgi:hypothetical protein
MCTMVPRRDLNGLKAGEHWRSDRVQVIRLGVTVGVVCQHRCELIARIVTTCMSINLKLEIVCQEPSPVQ